MPVVGTLGVMVRAKQRGLLSAIRPILDALVAVDFYVGAELLAQLLVDVGEEA